MTIPEAQDFFSLLEARRALLQNSENNSHESIPAFNVRKAGTPAESPNDQNGKEENEKDEREKDERETEHWYPDSFFTIVPDGLNAIESRW